MGWSPYIWPTSVGDFSSLFSKWTGLVLRGFSIALHKPTDGRFMYCMCIDLEIYEFYISGDFELTTSATCMPASFPGLPTPCVLHKAYCKWVEVWERGYMHALL